MEVSFGWVNTMKANLKRFCDKKVRDMGYYTTISKKACNTPITLLIGPNGTGKTMSLREIEYECEKDGDICIRYSNTNNDIVSSYSEFNKYADVSDLVSAFHSEGERIIDSVDKWAGTIMVNELLSHKKDIWVLFDELDSGLSIDKMYYFFNQLISILFMEHEKNPDRKVRFIFTCNSYEMLEFFKFNKNIQIIFIPTGEVMKFDTYEEFRDLYLDYYKYFNGQMQKLVEEEEKNERKS